MGVKGGKKRERKREWTREGLYSSLEESEKIAANSCQAGQEDVGLRVWEVAGVEVMGGFGTSSNPIRTGFGKSI